MKSLYDFSELGVTVRGQPIGDAANMPEEMFVSSNGNKIYLNQQITGFHTMHVEGRELMPRTVSMTHIDSYDGNILRSSDYQSRQIKVTYLMETNPDDPTDYRKKFAMLEGYISTPGVIEFGFFDDPNYVYEGVLSAASQPTPGLNTVISDFTFTCPQPFKKAINATTVTFSGTQLFVREVPYQVNDSDTAISAATPVDKVELKPSRDHVRIASSDGRTIALSGVAGKSVTVEPQANPASVIVDGKNNPGALDLMSDLDHFSIEPGGKVTCTDGCDVSLTYRKRGA